MSQSLTIAFNCILSDTVSNTRRTPFGGSTGWLADSGIAISMYQVSNTPISIGSASKGMVLTSDVPIDVSLTINGVDTVLPAQRMLVLGGPLSNISLTVTNGYATSNTNVALVS